MTKTHNVLIFKGKLSKYRKCITIHIYILYILYVVLFLSLSYFVCVFLFLSFLSLSFSFFLNIFLVINGKNTIFWTHAWVYND